MLYTDESSFEVRSTDKHERVWRVSGEQWPPECLHPSFTSGRQTVMVWGCFCYSGRTKLVWEEGRISGPKYADHLTNSAYGEVMVLFRSADNNIF